MSLMLERINMTAFEYMGVANRYGDGNYCPYKNVILYLSRDFSRPAIMAKLFPEESIPKTVESEWTAKSCHCSIASSTLMFL